MDKIDKESLLKDKRVVDEINRHLWIESEKVGHNIGFDKAAEDWLNRFATEWVKFNEPPKKAPAPEVKADPKKRSAKSYFK